MADRFDKFTDKARRVLTLAQKESQRFNHNYIGTEHLLLGLLRVEDGVAAKVLTNLSVDLLKVRSAVEFIIGRGEKSPRGEIGLTPRAKKVIELAVEEARRLNHSYIGTEHLLLGMAREGEGIAYGVLESLGVSLERVRLETARVVPGAAEVASGADATQSPSNPWLEDAQRTLDSLRRQKEEAIGSQQYERAAELRHRELMLQEQIERMSWAPPQFGTLPIIGEQPTEPPVIRVEDQWSGWLGTMGSAARVHELLSRRYREGWRLVAIQHGVGFWSLLIPRGRTRYIWERSAPVQPQSRSEAWDIPPVGDQPA
jgi:ATP-dependent Clp protease ATP-binding subunit ClpA